MDGKSRSWTEQELDALIRKTISQVEREQANETMERMASTEFGQAISEAANKGLRRLLGSISGHSETELSKHLRERRRHLGS